MSCVSVEKTAIMLLTKSEVASLKTIMVVIIIVLNMRVVIIVIIFPVHPNLSYDAVNNVIDGTTPSTILTVCHR